MSFIINAMGRGRRNGWPLPMRNPLSFGGSPSEDHSIIGVYVGVLLFWETIIVPAQNNYRIRPLSSPGEEKMTTGTDRNISMFFP